VQLGAFGGGDDHCRRACFGGAGQLHLTRGAEARGNRIDTVEDLGMGATTEMPAGNPDAYRSVVCVSASGSGGILAISPKNVEAGHEVSHGASEDSDVIEARREEMKPAARDRSVGGFQAEHATQRCWHSHRAVGV